MNISGLAPDELAELIAPLPRFRAAQIIKWIAAGVSSFKEMGNLPLPLREELARRFTLRPNTEHAVFQGNDGAVKLSIKFSDGAVIESVLLPGKPAGRLAAEGGLSTSDGLRRYTACLSTQAGCPAACVFCKTGAQFLRNLDSSEIVEQFLLLKRVRTYGTRTVGKAGVATTIGAGEGVVSNIVVMGMGEPLLNVTELRRALAVITCPQGFNFSRKRITVSTCGITRGITDLAENGPMARLALSLTAADEALRRQLMPITAGQPLPKVKEALRYYQERGGGRITLEAVLLGGINTRGEDAAAMAKFAEGLDVTVNLIPWNPVKGLQFQGKLLREPSISEVETFTRHIEALGMNVTRRFRRGRGILGACGQLGNC